MSIFRPAQLADLHDLQTACRSRGTEIVIIGAMAYRLFINDVDRETYDIDLAVTVDMEDLNAFYDLLSGLGWKRDPRHEPRWRTARGSFMDVLPAGPALRARGRMDWPQSGRSMTLAGFDHVFRHSVNVSLAPELICRAVPPPVLALMKIASYIDDPHERAKDLLDFRRLLRWYEYGSERIFSEDVFRADLPDIEFAAAFLLGRDMAAIVTPDDLDRIARFFERIHPAFEDPPALDLEGRDTLRLEGQIAAFRKGLSSTSPD